VSQGQYVALAYGVVLVFVLLWVLAELARVRRNDG
jgi:hypothetical protein